jgi:hypothetical protein
MEELCDLKKTTVCRILDDDYSAKDSVEGSYKLKGDSSKGENFIKYNNSCSVSSEDGAFTFGYNDNIEIRTNMFNKNLKAKLKGGRFTEHWDLGIKEWNTTWRGEPQTVWLNPYFRWGGTTSLTNLGFHIGLATYMCKYANSRCQLNYNSMDATDGNSAWSMCKRTRLNKGNFWMEYCGGFNLAKFTEITMKTLKFGYNDKNWGVVVQGNTIQPFQGGCPLKDSVSFGAHYTNSSVGTLVARFKHFMDGRALAFDFGIERKIKDCMTFKAKVDQAWTLSLNGKMNCSKTGMTFEPNLMTNLADSDKVSGLMDLPVRFGLKVKMNK